MYSNKNKKIFILDSSENEQISDDDGAPEDISFTSGRMAALQQMRDAIKNINAEKLKVKEKRKKIDEQFKEQKVEKLCVLVHVHVQVYGER